MLYYESLKERKMTKFVLESKIDENDVEVEDGGSAVIVSVSHEEENNVHSKNTAKEIFVRIQSWSENFHDKKGYGYSLQERLEGGHEEIKQIFGKKIRVTIEILED